MKVVVRADADARIGSGHVMRCLALARALIESSHHVVFVTYCKNEGPLQRLQSEEFELVEIEDPGNHKAVFAAADEAHIVVLDGYAFGTGMQHALRTGNKVMVVDDHAHLPVYEADLLLNQNPGADAGRYRTNEDGRMLLGPEYAMLRPEFREVDRSARVYPEAVTEVLVTLGGSEAGTQSEAVLEALRSLTGLTVRLAAGSVPDMASVMAEADLAVSAGGTTMLELAYMGVPTLAAIVAPNQEPSVQALDAAGIVRSLGWLVSADAESLGAEISALVADREARERMGRAATALIDGRGVERVVAAMEEVAAG